MPGLRCTACQLPMTEDEAQAGTCPSCGAPFDAARAASSSTTGPFGGGSSDCRLCGKAAPELVPFYLRTRSETYTGKSTVTTYWIDFPASACRGCFRKVWWLQIAHTLTSVYLGVLLLVAVLVIGVAGRRSPDLLPGLVLGFALAALGLLARMVVSMLRKRIVESDSMAHALMELRHAHHHLTNVAQVRVIPLAFVLRNHPLDGHE